MTEEQIGILIATVLFLLLIIPIIIGIIVVNVKDQKYKNAFKSNPPQEKYKKQEKVKSEEPKAVQQIHQQSYQQTYQQQRQRLPYQLKTSVMTNHEKIMYNLLSKYCYENKLVLLSKVRIADFIEPVYNSYTREFYQWFNKINCKHIDFLICDPNTIRPMIAIELDDYTHKFNNRKERDIFIDNVYNSVNLPIVHFWDINEISVRIQLNNILGIPNETKI